MANGKRAVLLRHPKVASRKLSETYIYASTSGTRSFRWAKRAMNKSARAKFRGMFVARVVRELCESLRDEVLDFGEYFEFKRKDVNRIIRSVDAEVCEKFRAA